MKHLKSFEQYDSPDVPKLSDEEIKDMTNVRKYYNKVQQGLYHKGSADINSAAFDKIDQEKSDILTIFGQKIDKHFKNLNILKRDATFNYYQDGEAHLFYRLDREIKKEGFGNIKVHVEIGVKHEFKGEKLLDIKKDSNSIYIYCSVNSNYDKKKEDKALLKYYLDDDNDKDKEEFMDTGVSKKGVLHAFGVGDAQDYTEREMKIKDEENKYNKGNFHKHKDNIKTEDMDKYIRQYAKIYNDFINYIDAVYDIKVNDLK